MLFSGFGGWLDIRNFIKIAKKSISNYEMSIKCTRKYCRKILSEFSKIVAVFLNIINSIFQYFFAVFLGIYGYFRRYFADFPPLKNTVNTVFFFVGNSDKYRKILKIFLVYIERYRLKKTRKRRYLLTFFRPI